MLSRINSYTALIIFHAFIALFVFFIPPLSKIYGFLVPFLSFLLLLKTKNSKNESLLIACYVVGSEVFLRMTNGYFIYEFAKYEVVIFLLIGAFYKGFSRNSLIYWSFIILLLPGIFIGANVLGFGVDVRKAIIFNILGEVLLFVSAIYCYRREISINSLEYIIKGLALPIITSVIYLFLYTPSIRDVVTGTQSNFETSGGFGPNQVSTILGLGMFCFFTLLVLYSKSKKEQIIHLLLFLFTSYRAIVTFSRGGVITGIVMIVILLIILFWFTNKKIKRKVVMIGVFSLLIGSGIWFYSVMQTNGLISNRYANKDAKGRLKEDRLGGREKISKVEIEMFLESPVFGIGVGKNKEYREQLTGIEAASHNELTRLLAEHGFLGIIAILILLFTPLFLYLDNKMHLFLLSFFFFWLLTINHAAMRLAAPGFIYALALLKIVPEKKENEEEKNTLYR